MTNQTLTVIQQGDQYAIEFIVKAGDSVITPDNCDDMKIMVGGFEKTYSSGELLFSDGTWYFPMTQEMSLSFTKNIASVQAQYKDGTEIRGTPVYTMGVDISIIREVWV